MTTIVQVSGTWVSYSGYITSNHAGECITDTTRHYASGPETVAYTYIKKGVSPYSSYYGFSLMKYNGAKTPIRMSKCYGQSILDSAYYAPLNAGVDQEYIEIHGSGLGGHEFETHQYALSVNYNY